MKKRRRPISDINVVPYLDVMLVLLVIFMITAPLFNQGVVNLPSVSDKPLPPTQKGALEIVYKQFGENNFQLIDRENGRETPQLSLEELMRELGDEKLLSPDAPITVVISADENLSYKEVISLLGQLRGNDISVALNIKNAP